MRSYNCFPRFLETKTLPDGTLACAILLGSEVFVGILILKDLKCSSESSRYESAYENPSLYWFPKRSRLDLAMGTVCQDFIIMSLDRFEEVKATWYEDVAQRQKTNNPISLLECNNENL